MVSKKASLIESENIMRILGCVRNTHLHGQLGGMEIATRKLYEGLAALGHEIKVVSTSLNDGQGKMIYQDDQGVNYAFLPNSVPGQYSVSFHTGVREYLLELIGTGWTPDIIHSASAGATGVCKNSHQIPVVATWHGTFFEDHIDRMADAVFLKGRQLMPDQVERVLLNKILPMVVRGIERDRRFGVDFDGHIAICDYLAKVLRHYGLPRDNVVSIPVSIDERFFVMRNMGKAECQAQIGFEQPDRVVLGLVGRGVPSKGYSILYSALKLLDPNRFAILIVGDTVSIPENIQVPLKIIRLPHAEMPFAYRAMDIYVNPTIRLSGFDMTTREALVAGIKSIVSDTSAYADFHEKFVQEGGDQSVFGLFRNGSPDSLANQIMRMSRMPLAGDERNLAILESKFTDAVMIDKHIKFFNKFTL